MVRRKRITGHREGTDTELSFKELRKARDAAGMAAMYQKGEELSAPSYSRKAPLGLDVWTCPACGETIHRNSDGGTAFRPCQCLKAAYLAAATAEGRKLWPAVLEAELIRAGVSRLYLGATFATFERRSGTEAALDTCLKYAEDFDVDTTSGLFLYGKTGTGKTHLAVAVLRSVMETMGIPALFVESVHLLREIKSRDRGEPDPVERCIAAGLLILDDIGNSYMTPFAQEQIYAVISGRYAENKPTIVTSNLTGPQLTEGLGSALRSRLNQMCTGIKVEAEDYRMIVNQ